MHCLVALHFELALYDSLVDKGTADPDYIRQRMQVHAAHLGPSTLISCAEEYITRYTREKRKPEPDHVFTGCVPMRCPPDQAEGLRKMVAEKPAPTPKATNGAPIQLDRWKVE